MSLLAVKDVTVKFGGVVALENVSLDIEQGTIQGLIGPNGAGKTTLINVVSGLAPASSGRMNFDGQDGGPWPMAEAVRRGIVRTFQQSRAFLGMTVRENLTIAATAGIRRGEIGELIEPLGLAPVLDRIVGELPYSLVRRTGFALAMALRPRLLLLDEPAVGLTSAELSSMAGVIREWNRKGITILLVEHNIRFLMSLADRVAVLDRGHLLFEGTPDQCQQQQEVIDVYLGRRHQHAAN